jgi:uncharacterized membrane protein
MCTVLAGAAVLWAGGLATGPWIASYTDQVAGVLYAAGGLVCHQRPDRSFHLGASQLPVCARCLGLYGGGAVGLAAWAVTSVRRPAAVRLLVASGLPTGVTVASAWLGTGDPANAWRALLAVPLGIAGGLVVGAATTNHLK